MRKKEGTFLDNSMATNNGSVYGSDLKKKTYQSERKVEDSCCIEKEKKSCHGSTEKREDHRESTHVHETPEQKAVWTRGNRHRQEGVKITMFSKKRTGGTEKKATIRICRNDVGGGKTIASQKEIEKKAERVG